MCSSDLIDIVFTDTPLSENNINAITESKTLQNVSLRDSKYTDELLYKLAGSKSLESITISGATLITYNGLMKIADSFKPHPKFLYDYRNHLLAEQINELKMKGLKMKEDKGKAPQGLPELLR